MVTAIYDARPDAIVQELTALPSKLNFRRFDQEFSRTNQLRTTGNDILLEAAKAINVRRFVAQSFAGWPYAHNGSPVKSEADPFEDNPPPGCAQTLKAIRYMAPGQ